MKAEEAKKIADRALEQLSEALSLGKSEQLTRYLVMLARFHKYSFGNVLMILSQNPDATHVAGFTAWKKLGRFVRKGEKGIVIIAPMTIKPKQDRNHECESAEESKPVLRFQGVHVFDMSQTDGEPLPHPAEVSGNPREHLDTLRAHIAERGIELGYGDLPAGADGVSRGGRISIREGLTPAHQFSVLVHEFAHELLHQGDDRPESKTVHETQAEAVAFVVCQAIGLESGTAASDYIQLYDGEPETLARSLDRIQRASASVIVSLTASREAVA